MIELEGICKTFRVAKRRRGMLGAAASLFHREYELVRALDGVSFSIGEGELVGYIGPNGAGKSTTVKVMSGILVPDGGTCEIMGYTPWRDRARYVQNIGVVFGQRTQLWWDVPVEDSFELLRDIYRVPEGDYRKRLSRMTELLDLSALLRTPLRQLSLGQRMRCELTASLLHGPRLLFLDEPTIGLDAVSKLAVRRFIRGINREEGVTVVLTTHDTNDLEALTDRILLLGHGRVLFDGSLRDIHSRFDAEKRVTVLFSGACAPPVLGGVRVLEWGEGRGVLAADVREAPVSKLLARLSEGLELRDVSVESRPAEEMVAALYRQYDIG